MLGSSPIILVFARFLFVSLPPSLPPLPWKAFWAVLKEWPKAYMILRSRHGAPNRLYSAAFSARWRRGTAGAVEVELPWVSREWFAISRPGEASKERAARCAAPDDGYASETNLLPMKLPRPLPSIKCFPSAKAMWAMLVVVIVITNQSVFWTAPIKVLSLARPLPPLSASQLITRFVQLHFVYRGCTCSSFIISRDIMTKISIPQVSFQRFTDEFCWLIYKGVVIISFFLMDQLKQRQDNQHHAMFRYLIVWYVKVVHT